MRRLLLLLSVLLLSLLQVACNGEVPDGFYFPPSNFIALNLNTTDTVLDPGTSFAAQAFGTPVGLSAPVDLTSHVTWNSANTAVASVSPNGIISANGPGSTTVTARLVGEDGSFLSSGTLFVLVTGTPGSTPVSANLVGLIIRRDDGSTINSTITIALDDDLTFEVVGRFSDGTQRPVGGISWRVSDPTIAQVAADGTFGALKPGLVSLNARLGGIESNYIVIQITP